MTLFQVASVAVKVVFWFVLHAFFALVEFILLQQPLGMPIPAMIILVALLWGFMAFLTIREASAASRWLLQPPEDPATTSLKLIELEQAQRRKEEIQIAKGGA